MLRTVPRRWWFETAGSVLALALAVLTLVTREWIEVVLRVDPDRGSGTAEWAIVIGLGVVGALSGISAVVDRRRPAGAGAAT